MSLPWIKSASQLSDHDLLRQSRAYVALSLSNSGLSLKQIAEVMYSIRDSHKSISKSRAGQLVSLGSSLRRVIEVRALWEVAEENARSGI